MFRHRGWKRRHASDRDQIAPSAGSNDRKVKMLTAPTGVKGNCSGQDVYGADGVVFLDTRARLFADMPESMSQLTRIHNSVIRIEPAANQAFTPNARPKRHELCATDALRMDASVILTRSLAVEGRHFIFGVG